MRKIVQFPLTRLILAPAIVVGAAIGTGIGVNQGLLLFGAGDPVLKLLGAAFVILVTGFAYAGYVRLIEQRRVGELSPFNRLGDLGIGFVLGAGLFATTIGIIALAGYYHITGRNNWTVMLSVLAGALISGAVEEIVMRGIVFRIAEEVIGSWWALLGSGLLFGFLHFWNPGASVVSSIAIALEAGVMLAAAYMVTRSLWFPIGIHAAWNFTQGGVFSVNVSGSKANGFLEGELSGPNWISGGPFGAEASVVAVTVCLIAGIALCGVAVRKGRVVEPMWRRARVGGCVQNTHAQCNPNRPDLPPASD
jgi:membrane protease YdiL (CAAX protease family)